MNKYVQDELRSFIVENRYSILWILDGYDEVISEANQDGSLIKYFLEKLNSYDCGMILTSRPQPHYVVAIIQTV